MVAYKKLGLALGLILAFGLALVLAVALLVVVPAWRAGSRMIGLRPVIATDTGDAPFDLSDPSLVVAASDYVFVGRVERKVGTRYPDSSPGPKTDYNVTVLEVIKGNLEAGQEIPISKEGGTSKNRLFVELFDEDDFMPEAGGTYIFLITVLQDGKTLSVIGSYCTIPLESDVAAELRRIKRPTDPGKQEAISKSLEESEVFARYVAAAENKDAAERLPPGWQDTGKRYKSVYEK